jgi:hypothetical protein
MTVPSASIAGRGLFLAMAFNAAPVIARTQNPKNYEMVGKPQKAR